MSKKHDIFGTDKEQEKQYQREARLQYDQETVKESHQNWNNYTKSQQDFIKEEGNQIYQALGQALSDGKASDHADVRELLERWHEHIRYFYEPTLDLLRGLGQLYNTSPEFQANFEKVHPELPAFLETAIEQYVDDLETAEIERMLAEDEEIKKRANKLSS